MTPGMRLLPSEDRDAMIERKLELEDRVSAFGTISRARLVRNLMMAGLGMPAISSIFAGAGYATLWVQLPIAALLGVFVAYRQPSEFTTGIAFSIVGMLTLVLTGFFRIHPSLIYTFFAYLGLGLLVGLDGWLRRTDGE